MLPYLNIPNFGVIHKSQHSKAIHIRHTLIHSVVKGFAGNLSTRVTISPWWGKCSGKIMRRCCGGFKLRLLVFSLNIPQVFGSFSMM